MPFPVIVIAGAMVAKTALGVSIHAAVKERRAETAQRKKDLTPVTDDASTPEEEQAASDDTAWVDIWGSFQRALAARRAEEAQRKADLTPVPDDDPAP